MDEFDYVSEADFAHWLAPRETLTLLGDPWRAETWADELNKRVQASQLRIAAEAMVVAQGDSETQDANVVIPARWWKSSVAPPITDAFWTTGGLTLPPYRGFRATEQDRVVLFGVRFDPAGVEKMAPKPPPSVASETVAPILKGKGGAVRKDWWDLLWIEMIRRIRAGTLKPKGPGELQTIMLNWLGEQGFYPGEDTLKKTASNLFKYLEE